MRVSQSDLERVVRVINRVYGAQIKIDWAYNKPRIATLDDRKFLSPRLSRLEMWWWLDGYEKALSAVADDEVTVLGHETDMALRQFSRSGPKTDPVVMFALVEKARYIVEKAEQAKEQAKGKGESR